MLNKSIFKAGIAVGLVSALIISYQGCGAPSHIEQVSNVTEKSISCTGFTKAPLKPLLPQRLTSLEYDRTVKFIFGVQNPVINNVAVSFVSKWGDDPNSELGYATDPENHTMSPMTIDELWESSGLVADAVVAQKAAAFFTCNNGADCAANLIKPVMRKAYRRSVTDAEVNEMKSLFGSLGGTFQEKMKILIRTVLMSPHFVFRTFEIPQNNSRQPVPLTGLELASRLSFFIWGTVPDETLLRKGEDGTLLDPVQIEIEIRRMLADTKSSYLVYGFMARWLRVPDILNVNLDQSVFPNWNDSLRESMRQEGMRFLLDIVSSDLDALKIVNADYSFINKKLANLYGIGGTFSDTTYVKTSLARNRKGILTQPYLLALNSASDHTVPVLRGKFVLEKLLCSAPGSPPDDVPDLPELDEGNFQGESKIRERLAQHRNLGPTCFECHKAMDPIGLSFENYNAVGAFRTRYVDGADIDASGSLPTGENLSNALDLPPLLSSDIRYGACFVSNMSSFAIGQNMTKEETICAAQKIAKEKVGANYKFSDAVIAIATSYEFLNRQPAAQ